LKHRVTHIINPFCAPKGSDLEYAQPITFETMRRAKENAQEIIEIELLAATYPEDEKMVPGYFKKASFLKESVLDHEDFHKRIKLPLIREILQKAIHETSSDFIIYSNVDIGLYPDFYTRLNTLLNEGHDALIINRKRIEPLYTEIKDLEKILLQEGKSHPGFDCFVFHRNLFEKMELGNICIGVPFIEISFSQNLFHLAKNFKLIETDNYTFHIGMEIFKKRAPKEYFNYNKKEFRKLIKKLDPVLKSKNLPYSHQWLVIRLIKQGLHPCIPIKLALKLEWKRIFG
jgi:hypothetical protein